MSFFCNLPTHLPEEPKKLVRRSVWRIYPPICLADLPALEVSFLESANGGSAEASAKADFDFLAEIRPSQTSNSLPNNYL